MIQIIKGTFGYYNGRKVIPITEADGPQKFDDELEARLVKEGVAKYIGEQGETAEQTMRREILEETGLHVETLDYAGSWWFARKDMLMLGYIAHVSDGPVKLSVEVDSAEWHTPADAVGLVHPEGSVSHALCDIYLHSYSRLQ